MKRYMKWQTISMEEFINNLPNKYDTLIGEMELDYLEERNEEFRLQEQ